MNTLKQRKFIHQSIPYSYNLNKDHPFFKLKNQPQILQIVSKNDGFKKLRTHFEAVLNGKVPNDYFNSKDLPRISQFKIKGVKRSYLKIFSKKLIRRGIIETYDNNSKLLTFTKNVFDNFEENRDTKPKKPGHNPILKNILIKDEDSLAIEIPIWKKFKDTCLTGHIDLIQLKNNTLKVIDYKPEGNFIISLPQVAMYGLLIKKIFEIDDLKCVSFNKDEAWEYDPMILVEDIMSFLDSINVKEREWEKFI
jgi:hypothetical protein